MSEAMGYDGAIPAEAITALEQRLKNVESGTARLAFFIRDAALSRFTIRVEGSRQVGGGYGGVIPTHEFKAFESAIAGIHHGEVSLTLLIQAGVLVGHYTDIEESFIPNGKGSPGGRNGSR
jgi:hypothetical protein